MQLMIRIGFVLLLALTGVSACGGGSSGGSAPASQSPPPPTASTNLDWDEGNWDEEDWQ